MTVTTNTTESQAQATEKKTAEQNFTEIRKALDMERQARFQAEERAKALEAAAARKPVTDDSDDDEVSDEPYVDHKNLKKKMEKWEKRIDEKIERKAEEKARSLVENERRTSYLKQNSDFNDIMQPELMQKFVERHPGLAEGILAMPEGFERQKLVYENIKALGLHKKEEPKANIQSQVDQNRRSPYYQPSGVGTAPYAQNGDFSTAGQKNAYAKMQELKSKLRIN